MSSSLSIHVVRIDLISLDLRQTRLPDQLLVIYQSADAFLEFDLKPHLDLFPQSISI